MIIIRIWHQSLIPYLPRQQLLGQHREACALRGKGWGRPHSVVNYVFAHTPDYLIAYHMLVMDEMRKRGYKPDPIWNNPNWRGKELQEDTTWSTSFWKELYESDIIIFPEHNDKYYEECVLNLKTKGIKLN